MVALVAVLAAGVIVIAVRSGGDDEAAPVATEPPASSVAATEPSEPPTEPSEVRTTPTEDPEDTEPIDTVDTVAETVASTSPRTTSAPTTVPDRRLPFVGETVGFDDGSLARVNAVTPNAPASNEFLQPEPGTTFTRIAVEQCAGDDGVSVNSLYFRGFLEDNTSAEVALGAQDLATIGLRPGGCVAGNVDVAVPDGHILATVVLTGALFDELARWSTASAVPVDGPLLATSPPVSAAPGEVVTLTDGATAVVRTVTPNAAPRSDFFTPSDGNQFVEASVEICAGTEPYQVNPLYWAVTMTDNFTASAALGADTLDAIEVAAGQCVAGTVAFDVPATTGPAYVLLTGPLFDEIGRWRAG